MFKTRRPVNLSLTEAIEYVCRMRVGIYTFILSSLVLLLIMPYVVVALHWIIFEKANLSLAFSVIKGGTLNMSDVYVETVSTIQGWTVEGLNKQFDTYELTYCLQVYRILILIWWTMIYFGFIRTRRLSLVVKNIKTKVVKNVKAYCTLTMLLTIVVLFFAGTYAELTYSINKEKFENRAEIEEVAELGEVQQLSFVSASENEYIDVNENKVLNRRSASYCICILSICIAVWFVVNIIFFSDMDYAGEELRILEKYEERRGKPY